MWDLKPQSELADATAMMARSWALATASALGESAVRGFLLWSRFLQSASARPAALPDPLEAFWRVSQGEGGLVPGASSRLWPGSPWAVPGGWLGPAFSPWAPLAGWTAWSRACLPAWPDQPAPSDSAPSRPAVAPPAQAGPAYSSYRSSGGHAVAQVIVAPMTEAVVGSLIASAVLSQAGSMLALCRVALGA